ncbi:MAG: hypothetical protein FWF24_03220 [Alphaproteobacteria bacterium]|nr:hypothetical protein [Alphaproteobacteria bacterium]
MAKQNQGLDGKSSFLTMAVAAPVLKTNTIEGTRSTLDAFKEFNEDLQHEGPAEFLKKISENTAAQHALKELAYDVAPAVLETVGGKPPIDFGMGAALKYIATHTLGPDPVGAGLTDEPTAAETQQQRGMAAVVDKFAPKPAQPLSFRNKPVAAVADKPALSPARPAHHGKAPKAPTLGR